MLNLSRYATLGCVVRNFGGVTKKLSASTSVLAEKNDPVESQKPQNLAKKVKNPTIAKVFASLNEDDENNITEKFSTKFNLDEIIMNAKTVNGLLSIAESQNEISRKHALKIVSILAEWSSINKAKLSDFENDSRFAKLCRVLGRSLNLKNGNGSPNGPQNNNNKMKKIAGFRTDDLNVVLGVTGDDEAAKLVASITLPQMVKVMKSLSQRKRRSTPLLRSLAFNMSSKEQKLDLKQCADVLYAMASLNFPDPVLIAKICDDIQVAMKEPLEKSAVVGSITTSLSLLKYRDPIILDAVSDWLLKNQDICRSQDITSVIMSLASLNYTPSDLENALKTKLVSSLTPLDFKSSNEFLGYVWSLMVLNVSHPEFFNTVLNQEFIDKLASESADGELSVATKLKLLNINAGVKLLFPTYSGSMLTREKNKNIYDVPIVHSREKQLIVTGMVDALKSLVPENCLRLNKDTSMGFVIDAEFYTDDKGNPVPAPDKNGKLVALMVQDFRDMCQGTHQSLNGITAFNLRLLSRADYHIVGVPYNEFSISDKLLKRVQYLEKIIKGINKN